MKIAPNQIAIKQMAGTTQDGQPILYILTHGGLHAFFTKSDGKTVSIGAAPHKGIATFLAEKKSPNLRWENDFLSDKPIQKSEEDKFQRLRTLVFSPCLNLSKNECEAADLYALYNVKHKTIEILNKSEVEDKIKVNKIHNLTLVRPLNLSRPVDIIECDPEFKHLFEVKNGG